MSNHLNTWMWSGKSGSRVDDPVTPIFGYPLVRWFSLWGLYLTVTGLTFRRKSRSFSSGASTLRSVRASSVEGKQWILQGVHAVSLVGLQRLACSLALFNGPHPFCRGYMTQKENAFQPLNMPDLEEIVSEAGEDGLQMFLGCSKQPCWVTLITDESWIINDHQWSWCMSWCLRTVIHHPFRLETFMKEVGWWILQMSLTSEPGIPGGSGRGRLRCKAKDCWGEGWKMDEHGYRCLQYFALMLVEMDR